MQKLAAPRIDAQPRPFNGALLNLKVQLWRSYLSGHCPIRRTVHRLQQCIEFSAD
jgi:hypothetical protein